MGTDTAKILLDIEAVFLSPKAPFTWASGIKSPIYCDNRLILSHPESRKIIEANLASLIKKHYPDCEMIMGTATAGIAHAALVADKLNLPMGYVRTSEKSHGRQNSIEGKLEKGQKVVVVEDLISTAGSVINVVDTLREAGANVIGIASIFSYALSKGKQRLEAANVQCVSLTDFFELVDVALANHLISKTEATQCLTFQTNPSSSDWLNI